MTFVDKNNIEKNFTIIIPSRKIDPNIKFCIKKIRSFYKKIKIIIVVDEKVKNFYYDKNIKILYCKSKYLGFKRNYAVDFVRTKFISFIDSDAFPITPWLDCIYLNFNKKTYVVGGPNISNCNNIYERIVSRVRNFWFVSFLNPNVNKKNIHNGINVRFLPSCNFSILKRYYIRIGGMDQNLESGEEYKIFHCCKNDNIKVYFNPKSFVMHQEREVKELFFQRMVYGKNLLKIFFRYPSLNSLSLCLALFPIFFFILFLYSIFFKYYLELILAISLLLFLYFLFCLIKINKKKKFIIYAAKVLIAVVFGPGLGYLLSFGGILSLNKIYLQGKIKN